MSEARPGVPAFGGQNVTVWNGWEVTRYPDSNFHEVPTIQNQVEKCSDCAHL